MPETEDQYEYIREWARRAGTQMAPPPLRRQSDHAPIVARIRGALFGLAVGDTMGALHAGGVGDWTQHTALALCVAESLLAQRQFDPRDQMERFLQWKRDISRAGEKTAMPVSDDISRALATYRWRGIATAGSHDPRDRSGSSLSRALPAALYACDEPPPRWRSQPNARGPRTRDPWSSTSAATWRPCSSVHCRVLALPSPWSATSRANGLWTHRPLKHEVEEAATAVPLADSSPRPEGVDVLRTLANTRRVLMLSSEFETIVGEATRVAVDPALDGAITGALSGAIFGSTAIPAALLATVPRLDVLDRLAGQFADLHAAGSTLARRAQ